MKKECALDIGLPVCLINEQGLLLEQGPISQITNNWRGLKVTVNGRTVLLEPVRYNSTHHTAKAQDLYLLPMSEFEHWQQRGSVKLFDLLMLRFRYTHDRLEQSAVRQIVAHLDAIETLLDQAALTEDEKKRVHGLIRMHGDKAIDRSSLTQKTHTDFMEQYIFMAKSAGAS